MPPVRRTQGNNGRRNRNPNGRSTMPDRRAYFNDLAQTLATNDNCVDFAFLIKYGGTQLHWKGVAYNPNANVVTHKLVDGTYDDQLATSEVEMMHVPVYTKTSTDVDGNLRTRTYNRPLTPPYPDTGPNAPVHLAFAKVPGGRRVRYALLGVCERAGPPTTFRPRSADEARRLYPYHLRKHGEDVVASTLSHDQRRSRYTVSPFRA